MIPQEFELMERILIEAHMTTYSLYSGSTKMYQNLKKSLLLEGMKRDISSFVQRCSTCQQVKAEYQRLVGRF